MTPLTLTIPCTVVSEANRRDYWAVRYRRSQQQKAATMIELAKECLSPKQRAARFGGAVTVRLTRAGGKRMDSDNLAGSFKAIRDQIAAWLGRDDGEESITWVYGQRPALNGEAAHVTCTITSHV